MKKTMIGTAIIIAVLGATFCMARNIDLPEPDKSGGKSIMTVIETRKSSREFSDKELPRQMLSDLMWAAAGRNRNNSDLRTIPTSRNRQEMDVYVFLSSGIYKYDHRAHRLMLFKEGDLRDKTGGQAFSHTAPVNIVIVSNFDKIDGDDEYKAVTAGFHAGAISQNIYLYCASVGLNTVVRKLLDYDMLSKTLNLKPHQKVTAAQTVGFGK